MPLSLNSISSLSSLAIVQLVAVSLVVACFCNTRSLWFLFPVVSFLVLMFVCCIRRTLCVVKMFHSLLQSLANFTTQFERSKFQSDALKPNSWVQAAASEHDLYLHLDWKNKAGILLLDADGICYASQYLKDSIWTRRWQPQCFSLQEDGDGAQKFPDSYPTLNTWNPTKRFICHRDSTLSSILPCIVFKPEKDYKGNEDWLWKVITCNHILSGRRHTSSSPGHATPSAVQIIPPVSVRQAIILAAAWAEVGSELLEAFELHSWWIE